ncbi:MAG: hypothetical protein VKK80_10510 [Prochlorothrix sp.]|nr:hypothetical protein [Prochlorothrix sp.]
MFKRQASPSHPVLSRLIPSCLIPSRPIPLTLTPIRPKLGHLTLTTLAGISMLVGGFALPAAPAQAGTCASNCGEPPIKFEPGEYIAVQVVNLTEGLIEVQESQGSDPFPLAPGRVMQLERLGTTTVNSSVIFWDTLGLALKVKLVKEDDNTLRVELHPNYQPPSDRSIYLRDDGQIDIF